ncbi:MAG: Nif3-like dinuclear metal center hexameric protein [Candidatus Falkowbacteria bacterium]
MQVEVKKIIKYCEDYLKVINFEDGCVNGLQVEGALKVNKIVTGVSLSKELIEAAIKKEAKLILVHHGFFKSDIPNPFELKGVMKNRLKLILENDLNIACFHLPLDAHPIIGNNISICNLLGVTKVRPFNVGYIGNLKSGISLDKFIGLVNDRLRTKSFIISGGKKIVRTVAVISGGSSPDYALAAELGADAYVCGDIRENIVRQVEEGGINLVNAGHYNTEKTGIRNLGDLVAKKFKIKVEFVDIPCSI